MTRSPEKRMQRNMPCTPRMHNATHISGCIQRFLNALTVAEIMVALPIFTQDIGLGGIGFGFCRPVQGLIFLSILDSGHNLPCEYMRPSQFDGGRRRPLCEGIFTDNICGTASRCAGILLSL